MNIEEGSGGASDAMVVDCDHRTMHIRCKPCLHNRIILNPEVGIGRRRLLSWLCTFVCKFSLVLPVI
jgi:hypothetical protein